MFILIDEIKLDAVSIHVLVKHISFIVVVVL